MPKSDYDEAVFRQPPRDKKKKPHPGYVEPVLPAEQSGETFAFDTAGKPTTNNRVASCKTVKKGAVTNYFVKYATDGPDKGHMLNPYSIYYREGDDTRIEARRGSMLYEFRKVPEVCFALYLKFLTSKISAYRIDAERAVSNG